MKRQEKKAPEVVPVSQCPRFRRNPFTDNLVVKTKAKQIKVSSFGKEDNVLVNQSTGEVKGTHVVTYRRVDDAEFIKMFTGNVSLAFDLSSSGNRVLWVMMWVLQNHPNKDVVCLDEISLRDFLEANSGLKVGKSTLYKGIAELIATKIIARHERVGYYYINPSFVFNGDRVAFTTAIERIPTNKLEGESTKEAQDNDQ